MQHEPYSWSQFRAEGKERAKLSNAEASERTKLRNYKIERFFGRKSSNAINPQQDSLLLTLLPQELRDQIWQSILEPPADAKATHFHICGLHLERILAPLSSVDEHVLIPLFQTMKSMTPAPIDTTRSRQPPHGSVSHAPK